MCAVKRGRCDCIRTGRDEPQRNPPVKDDHGVVPVSARTIQQKHKDLDERMVWGGRPC